MDRSRGTAADLSPRELQILTMIVNGLANDQIARM